MKHKLLLIAGLMATTAMQAQDSPWAGNQVPAEGGTFYLYNVATGQWLQNNRIVAEDWTTRAQIGPHGMDIEIVAEQGGYRLNPKFGHNHSINGSEAQFYMDTDVPATIWLFESTGDKTYRIRTADEHYLNTNDEGLLDDFGFNEDWILVTREERLADLATATKANPKDATWLIGGYDFANQDERFDQWTRRFEGGNNVTGGDGIVHANRAFESWNSDRVIEFSQTLTGIPNGTYELSVQGFYRDGPESEIGNKFLAGEEVIRASYFANDVTHPFMSICESGVTEEDLNSYAVPQGGVYIPGNTVPGNALDRASNCFFMGGYWNEPIKVVVSDGTLKIGMVKDGHVYDDWTVFDNFQLTYLGNEINLDEVKANLAAAIDEANQFDGESTALLTAALAAAQAAQSSSDAATIQAAAVALREALLATKDYNTAMDNAHNFDGVQTSFFSSALAMAESARSSATTVEALREATQQIINALNEVRSAQEPLKFLEQTIAIAQQLGVSADIISNAQAVLSYQESLGAINDALNQLRVARKIIAADKAADAFKGATPTDGDFYIYNVGLKRFLCGGGDWCAHAYVGFPGVEVTLISGTEFPENGESYSGFMIDTHLNNGSADDGTPKQYLNYGGYMDTPDMNLWEFVPVEGKQGVYCMARANGETGPSGERMLLGYRPGTVGNIDTDMYGMSDPNNQWKLVSRAERDELLATATADAPQDATYHIVSPNFNQREDVSAWADTYGAGSIWERGVNHTDFAYECWNNASFDLSQVVYDLLPGWYKLSVQGFYRDGDHENQIRVLANGGEPVQAALMLTMNNEEVLLPNITEEVDKAPGEGDRRKVRNQIESGEYNDDGTPRMIDDPNSEEMYVGEFPYNIPQACNYFQDGLYKTGMLVEVGADGTLMFIIQKDRGEVERDWVVVDNFRLTYYGTTKPTEEQQGMSDALSDRLSTGRTYNLQGQEVKVGQKGFFIRDGKKFVHK